MSFTADNLRLATGGRDGTVRLWEVSSGDLLFTLAAEAGAIQELSLSPDCTAPPDSPFEWCGSRLAVSYLDHTARIWDIAPGMSSEYALLPGFTGAFGPGKNDYTTFMSQHALEENRIQVWQIESPFMEGVGNQGATGRATAVEKSHYVVSYWHPMVETGTSAHVLNVDRSLLADVSYDGQIIIYDHQSGEIIHSFTADTHDVISTQGWHPDNLHFVTTGEDGTVSLWDVQTGEALYTLTDHEASVSGVGFSADGTRLATNSEDGTLRIWDVNNGESIVVLPKETGLSSSDPTFSPDGSYLALPLKGGLGVWNLTTGEEQLFTGHTGLVLFTAIDPSGKRVATCSFDGTVRIWDLETGTELLKLEGGPGDIRFSSDGTLLAVDQLFDETVHIFVLDLDLLIDLAKQRVTRSLTDKECQQYLHLEICPDETP
jgi:WD40 repeat protein